jgi:hypothetical protein
MISSLGNGLTVVIECDYTTHHDWMSFLTYWSLLKKLPEARVIVTCVRKHMNMDIFIWPRRCHIPCLFHKPMKKDELHNFVINHSQSNATKNILVVDPSVVFIRDFEEASFDPIILSNNTDATKIEGFIDDVKNDNSVVCCHYSNGWGKFVTSQWINKSSVPLSSVNFASTDMSINERRLSEIWKSATKIYQNISRG